MIQTTEKFSSGYIKEATYILLAYGLICASEEVHSGRCACDGVTKRKIGYHEDKKIGRRLTALKEELLGFIRQHGELARIVEPKKQKLFNHLILYVQNKNAVLEYIVCYMLYHRFQLNERSQPLHKDFEWLNNKYNSLWNIIDLLNTEYSDKDNEMWNIAEKLAKEL